MAEQKDIKPLEVPEFKSDIPAHLLKDCSAQDVYIMEQLSIQKQQNSFIIEAVNEIHINQQLTNADVNKNTDRISKLEEPHKLFKSKPMMIAVAIIGFTFLFAVYPYLISLEFKDLIPVLKDFFL